MCVEALIHKKISQAEEKWTDMLAFTLRSLQPVTNVTKYVTNKIIGTGYIICESPKAMLAYNNIIHNYYSNREEIDGLLNTFRNSLHELGDTASVGMLQATDRLIDTLRDGKDPGTAQKIWNEIKEGIRTGGVIASITSAAAALAKFFM